MRLILRHQTRYSFETPARTITHILRQTPRSHEGQHVIDWGIDVDTDCTLKAGEDAFGNVTHTFTARGPCDSFLVTVAGEIENFDTAGVVRDSAERMPVELYLRATDSTKPDAALRDFAAETARQDSDLGKLHALMGSIHETIDLDLAIVEGGTASEAFAQKRGNAGDLAQIFTTCARLVGVPARLASGYYLADDAKGYRHSWSEAFVAGLGWVAFDPSHDICPEERHIRVAAGLDGFAVAPVRGTRTDNAVVTIDLTAHPAPAWGQRQSQSQARR